MLEGYKDRIKEILSTFDLSTLSAKQVRLQIEQEFNVDLKPLKQEFDEMLLELMDQVSEQISNQPDTTGDEELAQPDTAGDEELARQLQDSERSLRHRRPPPKKVKARTSTPKKPRTSVFSRPCILSPTLAEFTQTAEMSRPDVVKRIWEHIKSNQLQDPKDKRVILCDEPLKKIFQLDKITMFKMNKHLQKHIKTKADVE